jgi:hypothetical protein
MDYFAGTVLSRPVNLGGVGDITKITFAVGVNTMIVSAYPIFGDWPWGDPSLVLDFELTAESSKLYSGSLGVISAAQAFTSVWDTGGYVLDGDGRLQLFAPDTVPVALGRGMWAQTTGAGRVGFNNALDNAAWTKTNITPTQDYPSAFSVGTPAGWRITATADGGTITQDFTTITPSGQTLMSLPHAMFFWDGVALQGAIELTQDGFVVSYDIRPDLIAGQWVQIGGTPQDLPETPETATFGVRIAKSGDSIGFCMGNVERGYSMTTPIFTPTGTTVQRSSNETYVNTENFPPIWNLTNWTVLVVCEPQIKPLPPVGDPDMVRTGWTVMEINNPYEIVGTGIGELVPYVGPGDPYPGGPGSLMTLDSVSFGSFNLGDRLLQGTGVGSYSEIMEQLTGSTGQAGTYRVFSSIYPDGQTTRTDITIQSRVKNAMGYGLNAALKPDDDFAQRVGLTVTNELADPVISYGFDPQIEDYRYNEPNSEGFSLDTTLPTGIIALRGDVYEADPSRINPMPVLTPDIIITLGTQYLGGSTGTGGPLDGVIQRVIIFGRTMSAEELSAVTILLQAKYAP